MPKIERWLTVSGTTCDWRFQTAIVHNDWRERIAGRMLFLAAFNAREKALIDVKTRLPREGDTP